jgi:hypothetical protein
MPPYGEKGLYSGEDLARVILETMRAIILLHVHNFLKIKTIIKY